MQVKKGLKKKQVSLATLKEDKENAPEEPCLRKSKESLMSLRIDAIRVAQKTPT